MSHLPGQPQFSTGLERAGQPSPHEATVRGHSAPNLSEGLDGQRYQFAPSPRKKKSPEKKSNGFSSTHNSALLPDTDPWGRQRRRLLGLDPDDDLI
jgi:hypothetical protein